MANGLVQTYTWRDARGHTSVTKLYVENDSVPANERTRGLTLGTDLQGLSNAFIERTHGPYTSPAGPVAYGTQADFGSIEDKAVLTFEDTGGGLHRIKIPAPLASIFLADGETVDNSNTAVALFITDMIALARTRDGVAFIAMPAGIRTRVKTRRKVNIWTLNPAETGPDE